MCILTSLFLIQLYSVRVWLFGHEPCTSRKVMTIHLRRQARKCMCVPAIHFAHHPVTNVLTYIIRFIPQFIDGWHSS